MIPKKNRVIIGTAAGLLVAASLAMVKGGGILYPNWSKPTKGTYDAPAAEIGKKAAEGKPWSTTTVSSAVDKPIMGTPTTVVGEIIDLSCYLQVGKHGDKHKDCGQKCVKNGQPVGLLAADGTVYTLMDEEHNPRRDGETDFRKTAAELMAQVVTVNGTLTEVEGQKALYVQGFLIKK
jgi:hypothetical protein